MRNKVRNELDSVRLRGNITFPIAFVSNLSNIFIKY